MTTQQHLKWLLNLLEPPYTQGWKAWTWHRAQEIAKDPEHAELPMMLKKAMSE